MGRSSDRTSLFRYGSGCNMNNFHHISTGCIWCGCWRALLRPTQSSLLRGWKYAQPPYSFHTYRGIPKHFWQRGIFSLVWRKLRASGDALTCENFAGMSRSTFKPPFSGSWTRQAWSLNRFYHHGLKLIGLWPAVCIHRWTSNEGNGRPLHLHRFLMPSQNDCFCMSLTCFVSAFSEAYQLCHSILLKSGTGRFTCPSGALWVRFCSFPQTLLSPTCFSFLISICCN